MNIFDLPKLPMEEEFTTTLAEKGKVRVERIVSTGQVSGWYDQAETEFVVLLEGTTAIEFENEKTVTLTKGDTILIAPHKRHRVSFTSTEPPCIWLCFFY